MKKIDAVTKLALLASLSETYCELNHGPDTDDQRPKAVNYIVQTLAQAETDGDHKNTKHLVIPVCQGCLDGIESEEWLLIYCLQCNKNHWINKSLAKNEYGGYNIIWLCGCHECLAVNEKTKAVYFS